MNDAVHVEVEVVYFGVVLSDLLLDQDGWVYAILLAVLLRLACSTRLVVSFLMVLALQVLQIFFTEGIDDDLRVAHSQPPEKGWDSHGYVF